MIRILHYSSYLQSSSAQGLSKSCSFIMRQFSIIQEKKNQSEIVTLSENGNNARAESNHSSLRFSRLTLSKELEKFNPSLDLHTLTNTNLESTLKSIFDQNKSCPDNFFSLLIQYNYKPSDVPLPKLVKVLELYIEPFNVTQENTYYLMNIGDYTEELWLGILKYVGVLNFQQLLIIFKSMNSIHLSFGKFYKITQKYPPEEIVEKLLERALHVIHESDIQNLAALAQAARALNPDRITKNMHLIQLELFKEPINVEEIDCVMLKALAINLPEGYLSKNSSQVLMISKKIEEKVENLWIGELIEAILGIHRSGLTPSFKFGMHLSDMNRDYLKTLTIKNLLITLEAFSESKLLTSKIAEEIFIVIWNSPFRTIEIFDRLIEIIYKMQKINFPYSIINNAAILTKISEVISKLSEENLLKASIIILPNTNYELIFNKFMNAIKTNLKLASKKTQKNLDLILELQNILINCLKEQPIFRYQLFSYNGEDSEKLLGIAQHLHEIIKFNKPESPLVFQFLADINENGLVDNDYFNVKVDLNNFLWVSKSLCKYKQDTGAFKNVIEFIETQKDSGVDLTEGLYYILSSCKEKFPVNLELVKASSPYYLSLCFELGAIHGEMSEIEKGLNGFQIYGEELVKLLVVCIENQIFLDKLKKISFNLSFIPRDKKNIDIELINRLISAVTISNCQIDFYAYSLFISNYYIKLSKKVQNLVKTHLLPHSSSLSKEFLDSISVIEPEKQNLSPSKMELLELERLSQNAIFNSQFINQVFDTIEKTNNKFEAKALISSSLKYLSILGNAETNILKFFNLIEKHEIIDELSEEDLENYYFLTKCCFNELGEPNESTSKLKKSLEIPEKQEYYVNERLNLRYYKPFKYETEYETRYLVSNKLEFTNKKFELNEDPNDVVMRRLKQFLLRKIFTINESLENFQYFCTFFNKESKKNSINQGIRIVKKLAINKLNLKAVDHKLNMLYLEYETLFDLIVIFEKCELSLILLDEKSFIKDNNGNTLDVLYPIEIFINHIEKLTGLYLYPINSKELTESKETETHPFMALLKKNIKS